MAKPNPLLQKRPLVPITDNTQSDFLKRMTAPSSYIGGAAPGPEGGNPAFQSMGKSRGFPSGAAVKIMIDSEDKLPSDYAENKEDYEKIAFGVFRQDPQAIVTLVESKRECRYAHRTVSSDSEQSAEDGR